MNAEDMREALGEIRGALGDVDIDEPAWLTQADRDLIVPADDPVVLEDPTPSLASDQQSRERERYRREAEEEFGVEALAWYRSFRTGSRPWGIFLRVDAIAAVSPVMFAGVVAPTADKVKLALAAILSHERVHHYIDAASAQCELLTGVALWLPHKREQARRFGYDHEEERIANAVMLRSMRNVEPMLRYVGREASLRAWTRTQPDGYCYGRHLTPFHKLQAAMDRHGAEIAKPAVAVAERRRQLRLAPLVLGPMGAQLARVPLYYVFGRRSMRTDDIGLFPSVRIVSESTAFKKQLSKAPANTVKAYTSLKSRLALSAPATGARMKPWPKEGKAVWSLRLNSGDRVHLQQLEGVEFEAIGIGSHKVMGHG